MCKVEKGLTLSEKDKASGKIAYICLDLQMNMLMSISVKNIHADKVLEYQVETKD